MKLSKFCPICGKEVKKLYENLCKDCFKEKYKDAIKLESTEVHIKNCVICNSYFFGDKKERLNSIELAMKEFLNNLKEKFDSAEIIEEGNKVLCAVSKNFGNIKISKTFELKIKIKKIKCEKCVKIMLGKSSATLQLRSEKWNEILNFINKVSENRISDFCYITQYYQNGFDMNFSSEKFLFEISNLLIKNFKLKRKLTKKLVGFKGGKKIFRTTILLTE
ncbi:MAG: NMD3-related protein [Candidatus Aenigmarchaeota archaeon]|nr:NMD3-related protein [Candidatus Aenigmarchaeota archaeon]MDW8149472.1 NMD3-related protein [Candidatus Aenigmarchaeota archaeon]